MDLEGLTAGVVGGAGAMGSLYANFFKRHRARVLISDINLEAAKQLAADSKYEVADSIEVAKAADILLFSVTLGETERVIREVAPYAKTNALITDVTSIKNGPVNAMLETAPDSAEVIGSHPMFRPTISFADQVVVWCDERPFEGGISERVYSLLEEKEHAVMKKSTAAEHDSNMAIIQGFTHAIQVISMRTIQELGFDLHALDKFSSPAYRLFRDIMMRVLGGKPELYGNIQISNPELPRIIRTLERKVAEHSDFLQRGDLELFNGWYSDAGRFCGEYLAQANARVDNIVGHSGGIDLYTERSNVPKVLDILGLGKAKDYDVLNLRGNEMPISVINLGPREVGHFSKISRQKSFPLARMVFRTIGKDSNHGHFAFYIDPKNMKYYHTEKKGMRFSPVYTKGEVESPQDDKYVRIPLRNRFMDVPVLNLFDTWMAHDKFRPHPLVVYSTTPRR